MCDTSVPCSKARTRGRHRPVSTQTCYYGATFQDIKGQVSKEFSGKGRVCGIVGLVRRVPACTNSSSALHTAHIRGEVFAFRALTFGLILCHNGRCDRQPSPVHLDPVQLSTGLKFLIEFCRTSGANLIWRNRIWYRRKLFTHLCMSLDTRTQQVFQTPTYMYQSIERPSHASPSPYSEKRLSAGSCLSFYKDYRRRTRFGTTADEIDSVALPGRLVIETSRPNVVVHRLDVSRRAFRT